MDSIADNQSASQMIPQLKILVVDDDALNQRMMQLLLTREGHLVDLASNGLEAFDAIKTQKFNVIFMDLQMPVMDGVEASRRIREWERDGFHTFIVALTASYLPEEGHVLFEAGIDNYVSKPFEVEQVQRLLSYGFQARENGQTTQPGALEGKTPSGSVLDIQKGTVQVGGDQDTYRELLGDFIEGLPKRLWTIQQYFTEKDWVEFSRAAHNLGGIAASLGASQLSACARELDKRSVEGYTESLDVLMQEIQLVVSNLLEVSNSFLAKKQNKFQSV